MYLKIFGTLIIGSFLGTQALALTKQEVINCSQNDIARLSKIETAEAAVRFSLTMPSNLITLFESKDAQGKKDLVIVKKAKSCAELQKFIEKNAAGYTQRMNSQNYKDLALEEMFMIPYFQHHDSVETKYGAKVRGFLKVNGFKKASETFKGWHKEIVVQTAMSDFNLFEPSKEFSYAFEGVMTEVSAEIQKEMQIDDTTVNSETEAILEQEYEKMFDDRIAKMTADELEKRLFKHLRNEMIDMVKENLSSK